MFYYVWHWLAKETANHWIGKWAVQEEVVLGLSLCVQSNKWKQAPCVGVAKLHIVPLTHCITSTLLVIPAPLFLLCFYMFCQKWSCKMLRRLSKLCWWGRTREPYPRTRGRAVCSILYEAEEGFWDHSDSTAKSQPWNIQETECPLVLGNEHKDSSFIVLSGSIFGPWNVFLAMVALYCSPSCSNDRLLATLAFCKCNASQDPEITEPCG